ncbi:MAG: MarR family transcriptional regulator [Deltaproteobacteria bacterium]|nr:MarR family transcriptional regulator [Deltaproteobacteria bacterium]
MKAKVYIHSFHLNEAAMDITDAKLRKEIGRNCACFNLRRAARLVTQLFDRHLRELGLKSTQFSVLMVAYHYEGMLLTQIASILGMERTTLTRNLAVLEQMELITLEQGEDRRERRVNVTPQGVEILSRSLPLWEKAQAEVVEAVGPGNWEGLLSGLHTVAKKL